MPCSGELSIFPTLFSPLVDHFPFLSFRPSQDHAALDERGGVFIMHSFAYWTSLFLYGLPFYFGYFILPPLFSYIDPTTTTLSIIINTTLYISLP